MDSKQTITHVRRKLPRSAEYKLSSVHEAELFLRLIHLSFFHVYLRVMCVCVYWCTQEAELVMLVVVVVVVKETEAIILLGSILITHHFYYVLTVQEAALQTEHSIRKGQYSQ